MFIQEVWWKEILATKPLKLTADWAVTCWSRLSYQDNYDRLTNCCCLVKPCPQIHTHTYTLACPHTVTTRRRLACPLTYHTNTYSTFRPSCPWKRANDCLTEDTMLLRHTFSHIHTHHTQWGLGRWLALGMELPPGFMSLGQSAVCSQLTNQVHIHLILSTVQPCCQIWPSTPIFVVFKKIGFTKWEK